MSRNKKIDIVKGIGIIFMVLGHCGAPFTQFIYLFHIGVFLLLSGICFNSEYSDSIGGLKKLLVKRIRSLWIPYFFINELLLIFHNLFVRINIYDDQMININQFIIKTFKIIFFSAGEQLGGATWFFRVLFITTMLYSFLEFIIKKITKKYLNVLMMAIAILFLLVGYILNFKNINLKLQLSTVFSVLILFAIGVLISKKNIIDFMDKFKTKVTSLVNIIACFALLVVIGQTGEDISIVDNKYNNPLLYVIATLLGFVMVYYVATIIERNGKITNIVSYVGKNTVPIILLHFVSFKVYTFVLVWLNIESTDVLKIFPIYIGRSYDYIIYTIFGVILPLIINLIYKKCLKNMKTTMSKRFKGVVKK